MNSADTEENTVKVLSGEYYVLRKQRVLVVVITVHHPICRTAEDIPNLHHEKTIVGTWMQSMIRGIN
jgi:hypothetical protein